MTRAETPAKAWAVSLTGLVAALTVAAWMRPLSAGWSLRKAVAAAAVWVIATALMGLLGLVVAESVVEGRPAWPGMPFLLGAAATWVLIPPMLLCWLRGSAWAMVLSAGATAAMAVCLRGVIPGARPEEPWEPAEDEPRFADLPPPDSGRPQALVIAVCVELAVVLGNRGDLFWAMVLAGVAAFVLVWKRLTSLEARARDGAGRPAGRAATATVLAMMILIPLLLARFARMNSSGEGTAEAASRADAEKGDAADSLSDAYRGIVLFTVQNKKKELPPVPIERDLLRTGMVKPLVIPFDGSYWYFQAQQQGPGLHPHLVHGDPVAVNIFSTGWVPLAMQAHQTLAAPVDVRLCGAMRVTVRNGDNRQGRVDMDVQLTDTTKPGKPSMYLGIEPLISTEPDHFRLKVNPVSEEVTFTMPARGKLKSFDEITVFFFPDEQRSTLGARMGIEQFELMPR